MENKVLWDTFHSELASAKISIEKIVISENLYYIVFFGSNHIFLLDFSSGECIRTLEYNFSDISCVSISPTSLYLATGDVAGNLTVWENLWKPKQFKKKFNGSINKIVFNPASDKVALISSSALLLISHVEEKLIWTKKFKKLIITEVRWKRFGEQLAIACVDGTLSIFDINGSLLHIIKMDAPIWTFDLFEQELILGRNCTLVLVGSLDCLISIYGIQENSFITKFHQECDPLVTRFIQSKGQLFYVLSVDMSLSIWNVKGEKIYEVQNSPSNLYIFGCFSCFSNQSGLLVYETSGHLTLFQINDKNFLESTTNDGEPIQPSKMQDNSKIKPFKNIHQLKLQESRIELKVKKQNLKLLGMSEEYFIVSDNKSISLLSSSDGLIQNCWPITEAHVVAFALNDLQFPSILVADTYGNVYQIFRDKKKIILAFQSEYQIAQLSVSLHNRYFSIIFENHSLKIVNRLSGIIAFQNTSTSNIIWSQEYDNLFLINSQHFSKAFLIFERAVASFEIKNSNHSLRQHEKMIRQSQKNAQLQHLIDADAFKRTQIIYFTTLLIYMRAKLNFATNYYTHCRSYQKSSFIRQNFTALHQSSYSFLARHIFDCIIEETKALVSTRNDSLKVQQDILTKYIVKRFEKPLLFGRNDMLSNQKIENLSSFMFLGQKSCTTNDSKDSEVQMVAKLLRAVEQSSLAYSLLKNLHNSTLAYCTEYEEYEEYEKPLKILNLCIYLLNLVEQLERSTLHCAYKLQIKLEPSYKEFIKQTILQSIQLIKKYKNEKLYKCNIKKREDIPSFLKFLDNELNWVNSYITQSCPNCKAIFYKTIIEFKVDSNGILEKCPSCKISLMRCSVNYTFLPLIPLNQFFSQDVIFDGIFKNPLSVLLSVKNASMLCLEFSRLSKQFEDQYFLTISKHQEILKCNKCLVFYQKGPFSKGLIISTCPYCENSIEEFGKIL